MWLSIPCHGNPMGDLFRDVKPCQAMELTGRRRKQRSVDDLVNIEVRRCQSLCTVNGPLPMINGL